MKKTIIVMTLSLLAGIFAWTDFGFAAQPGAIQKQTKDTLEYYRLERKIKKELPGKRDDTEVIRKKEEPPAKEREKTAAKIWVAKIVFDASQILTPDELGAIASRYEGRECTVNELFDLVEDVNALYKEKKYFVAKAILPPQKVEKGKVQVKLVEGHLGTFKIQGNDSTRESFILNRMSLKEGELIRLDEFEKDLLYLNRTNDIDIRARLKAGEAFGKTDAVLTVDEPQRYDFVLFTDNAGRKEVGRERGGFLFTSKSLLGFRDPLEASFVGAEGTLSGSVSYEVPVNRYSTRLGVSYALNQIEYVSGPLADLDMEGDSSDLGFKVTHPFIVDQLFSLNGTAAYHSKDSRTEFGGTTLFETEADDYSLGFDFKSRDAKGAWIFNNAVTYGEDNYGEDKEYLIYNLDLIRVHFFSETVSAVFRGSGQISDSDLLPSFDQFQVGGMATVRGYPEGLLAGDDGYFVSAEVSYALPVMKETHPNALKIFAFMDHGGAFPFKGNDESIVSDDFLTSVGCGLDVNITRYFSGRVSVGIPLASRDDDEDSPTFNFYFQSKLY